MVDHTAEPSRRSRSDSINLVATVLMIVASLLLIVFTIKMMLPPPHPAPPPLPGAPVDLAGAILAGNPEARVAMIEYSEFECPFCGRFARDTKPTLWQEYVDSGQVLVAFRHLALEARHPHALRAAQAGECANREGQFWAMHDAMFRDQAKLDDGSLAQAASAIGIGGPGFETCMKTVGPERIRGDATAARALSISATPSFLFGLVAKDGRVRVTHRIDGARPLADFQAILRKLIVQAGRQGSSRPQR